MSTARAVDFDRMPEIPLSENEVIEQETIDCPLCGGDDFTTVIVASDSTTGLGGRFRVVRCKECSLSFTNPRPTVESIGRFYPSDYQPYQGRVWDTGLRASWRRRLEKAVLATHYGYGPQPPSSATRLLAYWGNWRIRRSRQRQFWIPFRSPGRLLDFGCGAGGFLQEMKDFGWHVEGLDMSAEVADEVAARTGIPVHVGTLPHPNIEHNAYNAVTMWNSLEHVHQPRETVRSAWELLRTGGLLVVGVPNLASWSFAHFQHEWHGLELPRHLTHFTPETLCALLSRERFRVLSVGHIARVGWLRRSARRAKANDWGSRWLHACRFKPIGIRVADWSERRLRGDFIRVVAEKL